MSTVQTGGFFEHCKFFIMTSDTAERLYFTEKNFIALKDAVSGCLRMFANVLELQRSRNTLELQLSRFHHYYFVICGVNFATLIDPQKCPDTFFRSCEL